MARSAEGAGTMLLPLLLAAAQAVAPPAGGEPWEGFPVLVWRQDLAGDRALPEWLADFGGVNVERAAEAEWLIAHDYRFYVGHGAGRAALHLEREDRWYAAAWQKWMETRDPSVLVRVPCLSAPETLEAMKEELDRTLSARGGRHGLGVSLGDEVGLTPWGDPVDLCYGAACTERWKKWVRGRAGDDADVPYVTTDDALDALRAGDDEIVGAWLLRRRFHQELLQDVLRGLAEHVHGKSPGTAVGLLGLTGRTAFGGVAIERALPFLDFLEAYAVGDARELLSTMASEHHRSLATVFPEEADPFGAAWHAWEHWMRGGDGLVVWSDRVLARNAVLRSSLAAAVAGIRSVDAEVPHWNPIPQGVALLHSDDSTAYSWLRDALADGDSWPRRFAGYQERRGTREVAIRSWLRALEDCGVLPGAIPASAVGAETVGRFQVLVATHVAVLEDTDIERIARYLDAGGHLWVHGSFAELNSRGLTREDSVFSRLRAVAPDRVHVAPARIEKYSALRCELLDREGRPAPGAEAIRTSLRKLLEQCGVSPPPWKLRALAGAGSADRSDGFVRFVRFVPWLVASSPTERGTVWAVLPNYTLHGERKRYGHPIDLELSPPAGTTLLMLHPPGTGETDGSHRIELRPGEPAVFAVLDE